MKKDWIDLFITKSYNIFAHMNYKKEIKALGITPKKVAEKLGVSYGMMAHYLNKRVEMEPYLKERFDKLIDTYKRAEMSL